jgi:hypothetical protein
VGLGGTDERLPREKHPTSRAPDATGGRYRRERDTPAGYPTDPPQYHQQASPGATVALASRAEKEVAHVAIGTN